MQAPSLVTPEEAIRLSRHSTVCSIERADEIRKAFCKSRPFWATGSQEWMSLCLIATIYDAGRMQGIREERAKRKGATV